MKWTLQLVFSIVIICNVKAQEPGKGSVAQGESLINIALDEVNKTYVAPPADFIMLKSAKTPKSTIKVTYNNFPEEAKKAFQYAISIWENLIVTPVPVHVEAHWENLAGNVLAKGRPSVFFNNFSGTPMRDIYFPVALAEKISGRNLNGENPDIICHFNSSYKWYFGTDGNTPSTHYDFVSSVLHEITHGLGFSGFLKANNGTGFFNNTNNLPSIYDYFIFNNQNQQISDKSLFQSPSVELNRQLTSDNLKICQTFASNQLQNTLENVYAPEEWNEGSSIYHLKGYEYGEENGLMTPVAKRGEAIHNPGEITLAILSELGWKSVDFEFEPLKDREEPVAILPLNLGIKSDSDEDFSMARVVYSFDNFSTAKSVLLSQNETYRFSGDLELDNQTGKVQYYLEAKTSENRTFRYPADAPSNTFTMNIGPDNCKPNLFHNPVKFATGKNSGIEISAVANDNLGIKSVNLEYKINGVLQESVCLENKGEGLFAGKLSLPAETGINDQIEYRIIATDNSTSENFRTVPSVGFQEIKIHTFNEPVYSYSTDFEKAANDFMSADFSISGLNGLSGKYLHTQNPYPVSSVENEKYNLISQFKYPVILEHGGEMSFEEIVLVEPEEKLPQQDEPRFWDYVIVEASKNFGETWVPLTEKYNSGIYDSWYSAFMNAFSNNTSLAKPRDELFATRTIQLTQNTGFEAGDTVIIRFRMASDNSVNGFGWAIKNLEIQNNQDFEEELFAEDKFQVYPNPVKNQLFVEWPSKKENNSIEIVVTDLFGKTVHHVKEESSYFGSRAQIDLSGISSGIYMVNIIEGNRMLATNKIVKN